MVSSTVRIAWRNLGRSPRRTVLTIAAIAVAQMSVLMLDGMLNGFVESTFDSLTGPLLGHVQVHAPDWREERAPELAIQGIEEHLETLRGLPEVETAFARAYAPALIAQEVDGHAVIILGIDMRAEASEGGLLSGIDTAAFDDLSGALVGSGLAREAGINVGDELVVLGQGADGSLANDLVRVTGLLQTPMDQVNRSGLVMNLDRVQEIFALGDTAHEITIRGNDPEKAPALAARIGQLEGFSELETLPWRELAPQLASIFGMMGKFSFGVLFIVFMAAAVGVANTMLMSTFERRREFGVLLCLGTTPRRLVRMVLSEAVLLGVIGVTIGTLIGGLLVLYWSHTGLDAMMGGGSETDSINYFGVGLDPYVYPFLTPLDVIPGFVGIALVSIMAAFLPAVSTARLEPMEAMRS